MSEFSFVGVLVLIGFTAAVLIGVIIAVIAHQEKKRKFFETAARRLKGQYVPAGFLSYPRIEFPVGTRKALVEFVAAGEDDQGRTRVVVPLQGVSRGTLHILPEGFAQEFLKLFGAQDISIGDAEFDKVWMVKATPESFAGQVFSPDRRSRVIAAVRRLWNMNHPTIEVTRDQLRVQVREEIKGEGPLVQLVKTAEEFLEFLRLESPATGIEMGEVKIATDSSCPVCGTTLGSLAVRCETCKTPHHSECWKYVGQCSTYACNGKRWVA